MKFLLVLLLFSFGILCYGFNLPRIWNGSIAPPNKYPNVPRLIPLKMALVDCTGSIISDRHILTAAHCLGHPIVKSATEFVPDIRHGFIIDYNDNELDNKFFFPGKSPGKTKLLLKSHGIATVSHIHAGWKNTSYLSDYDIGILEFPIGTKLGIKPVILAKNYIESDGDVGISVGYGDTNPSVNITIPSNLIEVQVPILTKDCAIWKQQNYKVFCAGTKSERIDHGDSGGPFFYSKNDILYQIGIVHGGAKKNGEAANADAEFGIFNRISIYCDWIKNTTNGEAQCQDIPGMSIPTPPTPAPHSGGGMSHKTIFPISSMLFYCTLIIVF